MINRPWGTGAVIGRIYELTDSDLHRLGSNKRNPKAGTFCLCIQHTGDCFYDYLPLEPVSGGQYKAKLKQRFGAYCFGGDGHAISSLNYHLLAVGGAVKIKLTTPTAKGG